MIGGTERFQTPIIVAAVITSVIFPAYSRGWNNRTSGAPGRPLVEKHPPVDEKAHKAALERIPVPDQKYDPWGHHSPDHQKIKLGMDCNRFTL
jgi:hypothetical protein